MQRNHEKGRPFCLSNPTKRKRREKKGKREESKVFSGPRIPSSLKRMIASQTGELTSQSNEPTSESIVAESEVIFGL